MELVSRVPAARHEHCFGTQAGDQPVGVDGHALGAALCHQLSIALAPRGDASQP